MNRPRAPLARRALAVALAWALLLAGLPAPGPAAAATCVVTSPADDGAGSLRARVADPTCDTITFDDAVTTVTLTSAELAVARDLTIAGRGMGGVRVERSAGPATPAFRLLRVGGAAHLTLRGLTLANGRSEPSNVDPYGGGGVFVGENSESTVATRLTVEASILSGNSAQLLGGAIAATGVNAAVTVVGSTLSGNTAAIGGAIAAMLGTVTVTDSTLSANTAQVNGGAIAALGGTVTVSGSTLSANTAASGGAISGGGATVAVTGSTLSANTAAYGGGISVGGGTLTVTDCTLSDNVADVAGNPNFYRGGGIWVFVDGEGASTAVTVTGTTLSGNRALAHGGAIAGIVAGEGASLALTVIDSTLSGNSSFLDGAGISVWAADDAVAAVTVTGSTLSGNTAKAGGAGISTLTNFGSVVLAVNGSTISGNTATGSTPSGSTTTVGGSAGAISATSFGPGSSVTVTDSTISGNTAENIGGAIAVTSAMGLLPLTVTNSTISGNTAKKAGGGIVASAGGIDELGDAFVNVALAHTTLADNTSGTGEGHQLALLQGDDNGLTVGTAEVTATRSIFAHSNTALVGSFFAAPRGGILESRGYNVSQRDLPGGASGDLTNTDPRLGPLADNGGPTRTHLPLIGSPAVDRSPADAFCPAADQRGVPRPQMDACDSGAVEAPPLVALTLASSGGGTIARDPAGGSDGPFRYPPGAAVALTAQPGAGQAFVGWTVDGVDKGWANPLTVTMDTAHTVVATFAPLAGFPDVGGGRADYAAIVALASQRLVRGYADGRFGPDDTVQRAQMAALIARAMPGGPDTPPTTLTPPACLVAGTWDCEDWGNTFSDRQGLDPNLWRNVGALQHYGVAKGYEGAACAAKGVASPCYGPTAPVSYAETVVFITRAMIAKGYWVAQPGAPQPDAGVPAVFAATVATFNFYTGGVPAPPADWNAGATRGWFARALWAALDSYWGTDGTLPDGRPAGGYVP